MPKPVMISNAEYHSDPAISASHLHAVLRSPRHYFDQYVNPNRPKHEPTAAMRLALSAILLCLSPMNSKSDTLLSHHGEPKKHNNSSTTDLSPFCNQKWTPQNKWPHQYAITLKQVGCCQWVRPNFHFGGMTTNMNCGANVDLTGGW